MSASAWLVYADPIWNLALVSLRTRKAIARRSGQKIEVKRLGETLVGPEQDDFHKACQAIHARATEVGIDHHALAAEIVATLDRGARVAAAASARRDGRLSPEQRGQYRKQAQAAQSLAQWLAKEITERPIPSVSTDGVILHTFTEGTEDSLGDLLRQRLRAPVTATNRGAAIRPSASCGALARVVGAINDLHWIADLLRKDSDRARPQGAPVAPWKGTATLLRRLFEDRLGAPLLPAVATLAGLAHRCEIPVAEVSRLSKP